MYPFTLSYWRGYTKAVDRRFDEVPDEARPASSVNNDAFEQEPNDKQLGIRLNNVSKVNNTTKKIPNIYSLVFLIFLDLFISFPKSSTCSCCT